MLDCGTTRATPFRGTICKEAGNTPYFTQELLRPADMMSELGVTYFEHDGSGNIYARECDGAPNLFQRSWNPADRDHTRSGGVETS